MAVAFGGIESNAWQSNNDEYSRTVNKPAGLSAGDLLVAFCFQYSDSSESTGPFDAPSGWATAVNQANSSFNQVSRHNVIYKTADSSDVAASDFTFSVSSNPGNYAINSISLCYFTGNADTSIENNSTGTTTESGSDVAGWGYEFGIGINPITEGMVVFSGLLGDNDVNSGTNISNYTIENDNPTWTERLESVGLEVTSEFAVAVIATGPRPAVTATGNVTIESNNAINQTTGALLFIYEPTDASGTTNLQTTTTTTTQMIGKAGTNGTADMTASTTTTYDIGGEGEADIWTNQNRSSTTWTNQNKS